MSLTNKIYSTQDHLVRKKMFADQCGKVRSSGRVMSDLVKSIDRIPFDPDLVPEGRKMEQALQKTVGRTLVDAEGAYLTAKQRFTHLRKKKFPVTDYIRPMKDITFTPLPDLFHEYFGHMPQMFIQDFADMEEFTAKLFFMATTPKQQEAIYTFSWYSMEYGMIWEEGKRKARGAGLLSSPGDLDRVIQDDFAYEEATLSGILKTKSSPHTPHKKLFVFKNIRQVRNMLFEIENGIKNNTL